MNAVAGMAAASLAACLAALAVVDRTSGLAVFFGMLGPLVKIGRAHV